MSSLVELFEANKVAGKEWCYTDKWLPTHSYLGYYENDFAKYKSNVRLLEIGVCWGSSINLFTKYFDSYQIDGVDITPDYLDRPGNYNKEQLAADPNVKLYLGINSRSVEIATLLYSDNTFDLIVEDGDHSEDAQFETLVAYLPKLKKTGIYYIEDVMNPVMNSLLNRIAEKFGDMINLEVYIGSVPRGDDNIIRITYKS